MDRESRLSRRRAGAVRWRPSPAHRAHPPTGRAAPGRQKRTGPRGGSAKGMLVTTAHCSRHAPRTRPAVGPASTNAAGGTGTKEQVQHGVVGGAGINHQGGRARERGPGRPGGQDTPQETWCAEPQSGRSPPAGEPAGPGGRNLQTYRAGVRRVPTGGPGPRARRPARPPVCRGAPRLRTEGAGLNLHAGPTPPRHGIRCCPRCARLPRHPQTGRQRDRG